MGRVVVARLRSGDLLREEIQALAMKEGIQAGVLTSAVGSLSAMTLRMAGAKRYRTWEEELEIVSITGTVATNDCHIHLSASREDGSVIGGHLSTGAVVRTTAEVAITEVDGTKFERKPDSDTGYDELVVTRND